MLVVVRMNLIKSFNNIDLVFTSIFDDEILFLMIDSWNDSYSLKGNLNIINKVGFNPLFSITPGESSLQFNFDKNSITNNYQFSLSNNQYNQLGYMFVKFFHEHSLESDIYHYIYNK